MRRFLAIALILLTGPAWADAFSTTSPSAWAPFAASGGTALRSPAVRAADVINAYDQGVVCDGTTDNAAAIGRINTAATAGKSVYFPPAPAACLTSVALSPGASNITYYAQPGTAVLKPTASSAANPLLVRSNNVSNILVQGLTLDGGGVDFATAASLALVSSGDSIVFQSVKVQNSRGIGIAFNGANTNSGVRDSTITNAGNHWITTGLSADQQQGVIFCCGTQAANYGNFTTGSAFSAIGLDALSVTTQSDFTASNNIFKNVGGAKQAGLTGGAAIYVSNDISPIVSGNSSTTSFGNGIDVINTSLATIVGNKVLYAGGAGISLANVSQSSVTGNVSCGNNQSAGGSSLQAGLSLNLVTSQVTIVGNNLCDTQGTPTQNYGIQEVNGGTYTNIWVDQNNSISGSVTSPFGGMLTGYSAPSATLGYVAQTGTAPNQGVVLVPTGTGYVAASIPDGTTAGGNTPGVAAVSFSVCRSNANQIASAANSVVVGGCNNLASGQYAATLGGEWNIANGAGSYALGLFASTAFRGGTIAFSSGAFVSQGDAQQVDTQFKLQTATATPVTSTVMNIGLTSISVKHSMRGHVYAVARSAADIKEWSCDYLQNSGSGAATVTLIGQSCTSSFASAGASAWTFGLSNDSTNGGIMATATGAASTTINWVARIIGVENGSL